MQKAMKDDFFPLGKLEPGFLEDLLSSLPQDKRVIVGPRVGEDAAVIDFGKTYLVAKTDPITFTFRNIGWYAVNINANDIVCMGATPRWFLPTLLLPEGRTSKSLIGEIFKQMTSACQKLGIFLVGGHTEVTYNLDRPIVIGQMMGEVPPERLVRSSGAKIGDLIILTKGIAIEGTQVIYQKKKEELEKKLPSKIIARMKALLYAPGISVVKEALLASRNVEVHSMHDPTEGGLKAGLWELAYASGVGMRIEKEKVSVLEETKKICQIYGLDPLGLLASGALVLTLSLKQAEKLSRIYREKRIRFAIIGRVVSPEEGVKMVGKDGIQELSGEYREELSKIL